MTDRRTQTAKREAAEVQDLVLQHFMRWMAPWMDGRIEDSGHITDAKRAKRIDTRTDYSRIDFCTKEYCNRHRCQSVAPRKCQSRCGQTKPGSEFKVDKNRHRAPECLACQYPVCIGCNRQHAAGDVTKRAVYKNAPGWSNDKWECNNCLKCITK